MIWQWLASPPVIVMDKGGVILYSLFLVGMGILMGRITASKKGNNA